MKTALILLVAVLATALAYPADPSSLDQNSVDLDPVYENVEEQGTQSVVLISGTRSATIGKLGWLDGVRLVSGMRDALH